MKNYYRVAESNLIQKDWNSVKLKIALVFPNVYSGGMSGYTIQVLYQLFNQHPDILCERVFLPYVAFDQKYMTTAPGRELPPVKSLESQHLLKDFDWIAFSVHYELDYPHILWLLENCHIPYRHSERIVGDYPLILIGGPAFRSNGLVLRDFIDCGCIGDLEPIWDATIAMWLSLFSKDQTVSQRKIAFLQQISSIPGWWSPHLTPNASIHRVWLANLDLSPVRIPPLRASFDPPESNPLTFGDSTLLEINRGCPHGCRFCMVGFQNRPFRNKSLKVIKEIIDRQLDASQLRHFTLIGASVTDHPEFLTICQYLLDHQCQFSVPSIRIDTITPEYARILQAGGMKTIALAPEAGTDELRMRLNKRLTNAQILGGCRILKELGIENLKLYLLFGLPFEQDHDLDAMISLVHDIAELGFNKWGVRVSLNPFIPKTHTPFEHCIDLYRDVKLTELTRRLSYLEKQFKSDIRIKVDTLNLNEALIQTVFSVGDSLTGNLIEACYQTGLQPKKWYQLIKREYYSSIVEMWDRISSNSYGNHPWNEVQQGYTNKFLQDEWDRAENGKLGVECSEKCHVCGCCSNTTPKNVS